MGLRGRTLLTNESVFFVTTTCHNWLPLLKDEGNIRIIIESLQFCNKKYLTHLLGYVIMPNHIHLLLYFEKVMRLSDYMRDLKKFTSGEVRRNMEKNQLMNIEFLRVDLKGQAFKIWMDRFDDLAITKRETLEVKLDYIHHNPVKKGLVRVPEDYKYSSARFYYRREFAEIAILHYMEAI